MSKQIEELEARVARIEARLGMDIPAIEADAAASAEAGALAAPLSEPSAPADEPAPEAPAEEEAA